MTEKEYLDTQNLTKVRAARTLLTGMHPSLMSDKDNKDVNQIHRSLDRIERSLTDSIAVSMEKV